MPQGVTIDGRTPLPVEDGDNNKKRSGASDLFRCIDFSVHSGCKGHKQVIYFF